jgi:DNA-binding transcriptional ArsR family regulator
MEYKPKIVMTQDEFRVLASTTRIDIMKLLDESQLTVSDVSRRLEMNKATVHEHLNKLIEVGLVKKEDTNRKWVYYSLTWKGKNLLHPERVKVMVALATIAIAVVIVGLIVAMQGATVPSPGEPNLGAEPVTVTTNMLWQGMEHDVYGADGYPTTMNMEFRSSSAAVSVASIRSLECYFEYDPTSLSKNRPANMDYSMEGNVIHVYDTSLLLRSHGGEYLVVDVTVADAKANTFHFTPRRFIVPADRPIDLLISALGVRIDTSGLNLTHMVRIYFTVENRGTVNVNGARYYVESVRPTFTPAGFPQFGSPYLRLLKQDEVDVPANGTALVDFNVSASLLGLRGVVAFLDPESSVPEQNVDNNQATREVPPEVMDLNTPPLGTKAPKEKAPGMEAVPAIAAALVVAMLAVRARRRKT